MAPAPRLSVSSCGSTLMQHTATIAGAGTAAGFQYPRADRPSCSIQPYLDGATLPGLSVSSCGSTLMQPWSTILPFAVTEPAFSILVRIDPHAAQVLAA